jgi:hypothetical protein
LFLALSFDVTEGRLVHAQDLTCPPPDSVAGVGAVVGRVVDAQTQIPLGFAQIRLRVQGLEDPMEARSTTSGSFRFCSVPASVFTLSGQLGQFGSFLGPLSLSAGQTLTVTLELSAAPTGRDTGTLTGIVVDSESGDPVDGAAVLLPGVGQTAISNPLGRFTFPSLPPGQIDLRVHRMGYADATGQVEIAAGKATDTKVVLTIEPIALDPINVISVRRRIELPGLEDFERRYHSGRGRFVLEGDIQDRSPRRLTEVLWETGVDVIGDGRAIRIRRTRCAPMVYLDGIKLTHLSRGGGPPPPSGAYPFSRVAGASFEEVEAAEAVNLVDPMNVIAVEVYRGPAEIPGQYIDSNSMCGVILIWTRRGDFSIR